MAFQNWIIFFEISGRKKKKKLSSSRPSRPYTFSPCWCCSSLPAALLALPQPALTDCARATATAKETCEGDNKAISDYVFTMSYSVVKTQASSSMFLSRALEKILSEKEAKNKPHIKLRSACENALGNHTNMNTCSLKEFYMFILLRVNQKCILTLSAQIKKETSLPPVAANTTPVGPDSPLPPPQERDRIVSAEKYFTPFRLACESKSPAIIRTALDCLEVSCLFVVLIISRCHLRIQDDDEDHNLIS